METDYKEVDFKTWCHNCKHCSKKETESPCDECLEEPTNLYTSKPVRWEAIK